MTCVWDSLVTALKFDHKITAKRFCEYVVLHNALTPDVLVNDEKITAKQMEENFMRISALDPDKISEGYLCSTFDPLLILVCQLFGTTIVHNFQSSPKHKHQIIYRHQGSSNAKTKQTIVLHSDQGHMRS